MTKQMKQIFYLDICFVNAKGVLKFSKVTLGGFVFSLDKNKIIMSKENRNA